MFEINERIYSSVSGKTYTITWASDKITQAEVGFASTVADGEVFFIKRLMMRYPTDSAPGSPAMKAQRREKCDKHYRKYFGLYNSVKDGCGESGACVPILDYFREGPFYYTVYRKINADTLTLDEISHLPSEEKYLLLLRLVQGLMPMHALGVIHGDLKPENILVQRGDTSWRIRLIDMNDCYRSGDPNEPGAVVGTPDYYSPELFTYNTYEIEDWEDDLEMEHVKNMADDLTVKSDIFALGIIFCEFFSGERPTITDDDIKYLNEAVVKGAYKLPSIVATDKIAPLINKMLSPDYRNRPSLHQISDALKKYMGGDKVTKPSISFVKVDSDNYQVTIMSDSVSLDIRYTINGDKPDKLSQKYTSPFLVEKYATIRAITTDGKKISEEAVKQAWVKNSPKSRSKSPKIIVKGRDVSIEKNLNSPEETVIFYTTNGATPSTSSERYTGMFKAAPGVFKIKAVAKEPGESKLVSVVVEANVYRAKVLKPEMHYKRGKISINSPEGNPIYYTEDGTKPTKDSTLYKEPFDLSDTTRFHVRAVCIDDSGSISEIEELQRPNPNILSH